MICTNILQWTNGILQQWWVQPALMHYPPDWVAQNAAGGGEWRDVPGDHK